MSLEIWCHQFHISTVELHCDNNTVVHVINKTTTKDPNFMILMRRLMLLSLQHNIHFVAKHVLGVNNSAAYILSRLQVTEFQARFPHMEHKPTAGVGATLKGVQDYLVCNSLCTYKISVIVHLGFCANPLPQSLQHLTAFIVHGFLKQLAASSIRTVISSLSFTFQLGCYQDIKQNFIVKKMFWLSEK